LYWRAPGVEGWTNGLATSGDIDNMPLASARLDQFVKVNVHAEYLPDGPQTADVELTDRYDNYATAGDVSAEDAAAGCVREYELALKNTQYMSVFQFYAWLGGELAGGFVDPLGWMMGLGGGVGRPTTLEISADGISYSQPHDYNEAIDLGTAAYGNSVTLYVRETVPAGTVANPKVVPLIHFSYQPVPPESYPVSVEEIRGAYRIFNEPEYRFYRSQSGPPEWTDVPFASASSLPATPVETFGDGTWYLSVSYFNGVFESGFLPLDDAGHTYLRLDIAGGVEVGSPPALIPDWRIEARAGGVVRVIALGGLETGANRADEWAIAYTTNGVDPVADDPDATVEWTDATSLQVLTHDLPAAGDGETVKVLLQTRRNDGTDDVPEWVYSEDATIRSVVVDATGPTAPVRGDRWPGVLSRVE